MTKKMKIRAGDVGLFHFAPRDQGQTVEVSYAWVEGGRDGGMIQRVIDRSEPPGSEERETLTFLVLDQDHVEDIDVVNGKTPREQHIISRRPCTLVD